MQTTAQLRDLVTSALKHLDHVLPGQAPILDFVHHNTLHGFQQLPFEEALATFEKLTGISGYLPEAHYRRFYREGRINARDIDHAVNTSPSLKPRQPVCSLKNRTLTREDLYRIALLYDLTALAPGQLPWQQEELKAFERVQPDVPETRKQQLLADKPENQVISSLWHALLAKLEIPQATLHPETLLTMAQTQAEDWLTQRDNSEQTDQVAHPVHSSAQHVNPAEQALADLFAKVGDSLSLRGVLLALTGIDILEHVRPHLIRLCASVLDEGVAAWTLPERENGFYTAWRSGVDQDANVFLQDCSGWQQILAALPEDPVDAIILQLTQLGIPSAQWAGYCQRLTLELPGWSGLINWREQHPDYAFTANAPLTLADYLAIRLTLDRLWLNQVCRQAWAIDATLEGLQRYFRKHLAEFSVRQGLYQGDLPEYLTQRAQVCVNQAQSEWHPHPDWSHLADLIDTWKNAAKLHTKTASTPYNSGWRLFRLMQHLGLRADDIKLLSQQQLLDILAILDAFTQSERVKVWLVAYEHHYREAFFQALHANHKRGRWATRETRPEAQLIFCIDDREEGFRRHLEEHNPALETLGAAGFFGVPIHYKGLDDTKTTPLCPIVVTPTNEVQEHPRQGNDAVLMRHQRGRIVLRAAANSLYQGLRRNLFRSPLIITLIAPITLVGLLAKTFFPNAQKNLLAALADGISPNVETELQVNAPEVSKAASLDASTLGFTDTEQVDRVAGFLRNAGLAENFSPLVILMGHGSISQNNPHLAAYDCGACSGRHGGPNARLFAAMANRPVIRKKLAERDIHIPDDTWFIGAEHNTCNEAIIWYDLQDSPAQQQSALQTLQRDIQHAQRLSAHERCRRLASAPRNPTPHQALQHCVARASDYSQARPELGHATNAAAVVGRRALTQGAFFDRRIFLISYDPTTDADGKILENILLAVGPVGAGINLEYYFSTVNNERFGCGSKIPHNVTGFFGVMEGTSSDLRTGLPQQMIEIHEAMRLQLVVETKPAVLERIYAEQASIRELVGGGWVLLSAKDPETGEIFIFERGAGFVPWTSAAVRLAMYANSPECYANQTLPVAPALIKQPRELST